MRFQRFSTYVRIDLLKHGTMYLANFQSVCGKNSYSSLLLRDHRNITLRKLLIEQNNLSLVRAAC